MKDSGKHALWIYGVIVGLALRDSITLFFPHDRTTASSYHEFLEFTRFLIFIFIACRFYLGAARYFEEVHSPTTDATKFPDAREIFGLDFLVGLFHFLFIFGLSGTIIRHDIWAFGLTPAFVLLLGILCYDVIWWIVSAKSSTRNLIGTWTALNLVTAISSFIVFVLVRAAYYRFDSSVVETASISAELAAFVPVIYFGAWDFKALIKDVDCFPPWLRHLTQVLHGRA